MSDRNGKIYANNITPEQRAWLQKYMNSTGFEPMLQEDLDSGKKTFSEVARWNLDWFENWMHDAFHEAEKGVYELHDAESEAMNV